MSVHGTLRVYPLAFVLFALVGIDNTPVQGQDGKRADATPNRNMRWVLRFKVTSGKDYIDQMKAMGAEILVPIPDSDKAIYIADLNKPNEHKTPSDDDLKKLAERFKLSDTRPEAVKAICGAISIDKINPKSLSVFFPKDLEEELAKKELSYGNLRAENIAQTIFRVTVKDGKYEIEVVEQKAKK